MWTETKRYSITLGYPEWKMKTPAAPVDCCTDNPAEARYCRHCGKNLLGESPLRPAVEVMQDLHGLYITQANGRTLTTHGPVTETWETGDVPKDKDVLGAVAGWATLLFGIGGLLLIVFGSLLGLD